MEAPSRGQSNVKGVVHTWYQFSVSTSERIRNFETQSLSSWNSLRALWYVNGVKVVPQNISELMTPISLAYWLCDDGEKNGKGFHFATNAFTAEDVRASRPNVCWG